MLVVWAVPIKSYRLPVALPFSLELYRLVLIVLVGAWLVAIVTGTRGVSAAGLGKPLGLLAAVGVLSIVANTNALSAPGSSRRRSSRSRTSSASCSPTCSSARRSRALPAAELVVRALVLGAAAIAIAAIYEARTNYDVFDHLHKWFSFLEPTRAIKESARRGTRLRVHASAQHPIALGAALTMAMPLAAYLATRARNQAAAFFWGAAGVLCVVGALTTVSRTVVSMAVAMTIVTLLVRKQVVARFWPLAIVLLAAVHLAAPHTLGSLYHSFLPKGGLVHSQTARAGNVGSGRVADIGPGLRSWKQAPVFGHGLGTGKVARSTSPGAIVDPKTGAPIIFDDQYLNSLVSIGFLGLVGVLWFVWGGVRRMVTTARHRARAPRVTWSPPARSRAPASASGMLTFDAFAFVQCTLVFFVIAAIGLRTRALVE